MTVARSPLLAAIEREPDFLSAEEREEAERAKTMRTDRRTASVTLPPDYFQRELQIAIDNLEKCGASMLSSAATIMAASTALEERAKGGAR